MATPAAPTAPAAATAAAPSVEVSPEMKDDLGMSTLEDPKVTSSEKVGALTCYTMASTAGAMDHTTKLCWNDKGKIAAITDTQK